MSLIQLHCLIILLLVFHLPQPLNLPVQSLNRMSTSSCCPIFSTSCSTFTKYSSHGYKLRNKQALAVPAWKQAMEEELTALKYNGTWSLVSLPPSRHAVGCKWVYRVKENAVAALTDTRLATIIILLILAVTHGWFLQQIDVNNAILNGYLQEEIKSLRLPMKFGSHRGFAFVQYDTQQEAQNALNAFSSTHLIGRRMVIERANESESLEQLRARTAAQFRKDNGFQNATKLFKKRKHFDEGNMNFEG
ncbi:hypothetical protein OROGR_020865 [Orobanche gracilis]